MTSYYNPVEIVFGTSSLNQIEKLSKKFSQNNKILIIADRFLRDLGTTGKIENSLQDAGFKVTIFEKIKINPTFNSIDDTTVFATNDNYGLIVGIGGGSTLDCAKCAAILAKNRGSIKEFLAGNKEIMNSGIPLVEIPTTAGTGSEVTMWATVWREDGITRKKYSLSDEKMYAKAALLDPELTISMPPKLTAVTGLDALSQAIEAFWSKNHNPKSDKHALKAISLIIENLENAYNNPLDIKYREKMLLGSLGAGLAFSNTKTTAVHSVSYPISAYFDVPHGLACALTLGSFLEFNSVSSIDNLPETPERIAKISKLLDSNDAFEARIRIESLMKIMNLPTKLSQLGIYKKDIEVIVKEGFTKGRIENNPRKVTRNDLFKILINIM